MRSFESNWNWEMSIRVQIDLECVTYFKGFVSCLSQAPLCQETNKEQSSLPHLRDKRDFVHLQIGNSLPKFFVRSNSKSDQILPFQSIFEKKLLRHLSKWDVAFKFWNSSCSCLSLIVYRATWSWKIYWLEQQKKNNPKRTKNNPINYCWNKRDS